MEFGWSSVGVRLGSCGGNYQWFGLGWGSVGVRLEFGWVSCGLLRGELLLLCRRLGVLWRLVAGS